MIATRVSASVFFASAVTGFSALSGTLAAPIAHADPLDNIRGAVIANRANTGCPPLNNNGQLEADAQAFVRSYPSGYNANPGGYPGVLNSAARGKDRAEDAMNEALVDLSSAFHDCTEKDYGVGMVRSNDQSIVAIYLGQPPAPAAPPPANNAPPNNTNTGGDAKQQAEPPAAAQQAPHDAISLQYGQFGDNGLPVTVTNSSSVPGACTYDSTPLGFHQDFNVGANTSTTFDIAGLPTGTTYNVKVQCMGQFNGATVVIGGVNTTKKF